MATRSSHVRPGRRAFLKNAGAASAAALTIGFQWAATSRRALALAGGAAAENVPFVPNAFLRIDGDGNVTVIAKHVEMGQIKRLKGTEEFLPRFLATVAPLASAGKTGPRAFSVAAEPEGGCSAA